MIVAEFAVVPMGVGTSARKYIEAVEQMLARSGVRFIPGAMSTTIETRSMREAFDLVEKASKVLADMGVQRTITTLRIDCRLDKENSIDAKLGEGKASKKIAVE
jgi:uncharacterized protein (TIGR00106 family)